MGGVKDHLKEGDCHGEEHPDVDHLDVRSNRQALGKAQEAKKCIKALGMRIFCSFSRNDLYQSVQIGSGDLHSCEDQKNGKVDFYDHVHVLLSKDPCSEADDDEEHGRNKNGQ